MSSVVTESFAEGPLSGLVVADFSRVLAGPYCTMLLADLGAEVIKVESPAGDDTRQWLPPSRNHVSTYFLAVNRNKRSVVLDLSDPEDLAAAHTLSERSDIFIQNFKVGSLRSYGLDYDSVSKRNPRTIYCSISGFGSGKGASLPGYDLLVQGASGLMSLTGEPDGPGYRAGASLFDIVTGLHSAIGILSALHQRQTTGQGQHVETNLLSSALSALANQASAFVAGGVIPHRLGNAHPSLFPYEPLPTADGDLIVVAGNDAQFRKLCVALGLPDLADDPEFASNEERNRNRARLRPILVDRLAARPRQDWLATLTKAGVPCGPVNTLDGGIELAQELGLEPVVLAGTGDDAVPTIRNPIRMSGAAVRYVLPPPFLNADGDDVRAWLNGPG
jgi:crotonobetainyl-CoA:carnitine CoA-transferase CaiB-like acyl-CoA transferase